MKPTEEDLRAADEVLVGTYLPYEHQQSLRRRIASALTTEREKAAKGDINTALAELREMFAGQDKFPPYITAGFNPNGDWQNLFVIHLVIDGIGQHFEGTSLSEAMQKVREWAAIRAGDKE